MGVSTDGILCYGLTLPDYDDMPYEALPWVEGDEEEFEDTLLRLAGSDAAYYSDEWKAVVQNHKLELVRYCHAQFPMWILAVKGTVTTSSRGYPVKIENLLVDSAGINELWTWQTLYDLQGEEGWWLCSYSDH